jgi:hypothetical protein
MSKSNLQFSKYLNKNVNLITILGIFNGLTLYGSTLDDSNEAYIIGFVFTFLSVLIIRELVLKIPKKEKLEFPLLSFLVSIAIVWLSLIYFLFKKYIAASSMTALIMLVIGTMFMTFRLVNNNLLKRIKKSHPKLHTVISVVLVLSLFIAAIIFWSSILDFFYELFTPLIPKKIAY